MIQHTGTGPQAPTAFHTIAADGFYLLAMAASCPGIPAGATVKFDVSCPALSSGLDVSCAALQPAVARTKSQWVYLHSGDVLSLGVSLTGTHPTPPAWTCDLYVYTATDLA
jgi:hypothetical protein